MWSWILVSSFHKSGHSKNHYENLVASVWAIVIPVLCGKAEASQMWKLVSSYCTESHCFYSLQRVPSSLFSAFFRLALGKHVRLPSRWKFIMFFKDIDLLCLQVPPEKFDVNLSIFYVFLLFAALALFGTIAWYHCRFSHHGTYDAFALEHVMGRK